MTFAVPLFLAAALAGLIPVALHMISRQRAKDLPYSTLRFLRVAVQKTRRRRKIQDMFLMLLRVAVLLLVALGLSRPTVTNLRALFGGAATAVAVVLDNSASMGMIDQGKLRFETARDATRQILDSLKSEDQVALWVTGGPKLPGQAKLEATQDNARQILNQVNVSYMRADLAAKIADARRVLLKSDAPNKTIFVVTDQQLLSWDGLRGNDSVGNALRGVPGKSDPGEQLSEDEKKIRDIPVVIIDCNRTPKPNVAVTKVEVEASVPVAGIPMKAVAELLNTSAVDQERHVELYIDGVKEASSPDLKIAKTGKVSYEFAFIVKRGGLHRGEVRLVGDDGSKYDDRRFFTIETSQGIPVAIVKSEKHDVAYLDDTFYVQRALMPAKGGSWAIKAVPMVASELGREPLSDYTAVFCVNLKAPGADLAERLRSYVEAGGNLVWICGENVNPDEYNRMNEQSKRQLLPAKLLGVRAADPAQGKDSWNITYLDDKHPALRQLNDPPSLYQSVLVYKHVRIDAKEPGLAVLARLDGGEPLLVERQVGRGKVVMLATSGHVGWSNFPLRPLFLPLLARMTFQFAGAEQTRHTALAGLPLVVPLDEKLRSSSAEIQPPSGTVNRFKLVDEKGQRLKEFRYPDTDEIGIYLVRLLGGAKPVEIAYSVNVDPEESNPAKIDHDELMKRFGKTPLVFADDPEHLDNVFKLLREGKSLWGMFLTAVLVVLIFETLVSNRLTPKKEEDEVIQVVAGVRRRPRKSAVGAASGKG
jgi:hypothetical protein